MWSLELGHIAHAWFLSSDWLLVIVTNFPKQNKNYLITLKLPFSTVAARLI